MPKRKTASKKTKTASKQRKTRPRKRSEWTAGRKAGGTNSAPAPGSYAEKVVEMIRTGSYRGPTQAARALGCSVNAVVMAVKRWKDYADELGPLN